MRSNRLEDDDLLMEYLRWACCVMYGMTREKELFDTMSNKSRGPVNAITLLAGLDQMANDYAALFNPGHPKWNEYPGDVRTALRTIIRMDVKQMRPLLLAIGLNFSKTNVVAAFTGLISWSVRLAIAGGISMRERSVSPPPLTQL